MELSTAALILALVLILFLVNLILQREIGRQAEFQSQLELRDKLRQFRLSKMLAFLGVDSERYIRKLPKEDIHRHLETCSQCSNIPACDSHLRDGKPVTNMNFCPNYKSLIRHSATTLRE